MAPSNFSFFQNQTSGENVLDHVVVGDNINKDAGEMVNKDLSLGEDILDKNEARSDYTNDPEQESNQDLQFGEDILDQEVLKMNIMVRRKNSVREVFRQDVDIGLSTTGAPIIIGKRKLSPETTTPTGVPGKRTQDMFASPKLRQRLVSETLETTSNWSRPEQHKASRPRANTVTSISTQKTRRRVSVGRRRNSIRGYADPNQQLLTNMFLKLAHASPWKAKEYIEV